MKLFNNENPHYSLIPAIEILHVEDFYQKNVKLDLKPMIDWKNYLGILMEIYFFIVLKGNKPYDR